MATLFMLLLGSVAVFLILLVLVQRGRGGGLAGALGGMGGSSAFGAKAGDVFTKITIVVATIWILLCIVATKVLSSSESRIDIEGRAPASSSAQEESAPESESAEKLTEATDQPSDKTNAQSESEEK